jgi:GTP cyclohydrolase I
MHDDPLIGLAAEMLAELGEDRHRSGLLETPQRYAKAWREWTSGYQHPVKDVFKCFTDGAEKVDELVLLKNLPFYSHCEHHLAPFFGVAHIGYIPNGKILGLSKFSRLLDVFAKRLQVQERLTNQVADAIVEHLEPLGCGVVLKARHLCMESRGIRRQGHETVTSALRGVLITDQTARSEFMGLIA